MTASEAEWLAQAAERLSGVPRPGPGPLRTYLREHLEAVLEVKTSRNLTWGQIAALLSERGLTKADGSPLDANVVAVTASHVRQADLGQKPKKGRAGKGGRVPRETPKTEPAPATVLQPPKREAEGQPAMPAAQSKPGWMERLAEVEQQRSQEEEDDRPKVQHRPGMRG